MFDLVPLWGSVGIGREKKREDEHAYAPAGPRVFADCSALAKVFCSYNLRFRVVSGCLSSLPTVLWLRQRACVISCDEFSLGYEINTTRAVVRPFSLAPLPALQRHEEEDGERRTTRPTENRSRLVEQMAQP